MFVGSTAQRLQQKLRVPLLIARNRSARGYERALVAIDFTRASAEAAHAVARLFPNAALHFLHVHNPSFETRLSFADVSADAIRAYRNQVLLEASHELDSFIRSNGLQSRRASSVVKQGYVPACIEESATELGVQVVAFGGKGRSRWEANVLGSVSEMFSGGAGYDVLLAKANAPLSGKQRSDRLRQRDAEAEAAGA
jgi:nucleotide-binding universal stress UspA family protein